MAFLGHLRHINSMCYPVSYDFYDDRRICSVSNAYGSSGCPNSFVEIRLKLTFNMSVQVPSVQFIVKIVVVGCSDNSD